MELESYERRTSGVNYAPRHHVTVSSAPMRFHGEAMVMGQSIALIGPMATCGSDCRDVEFRVVGAADAVAIHP